MANQEVFLSYTSGDRELVADIAKNLEEHGLVPFFDRWSLVPGEPWQERLEVALETCAACIVFIGSEIGSWQNEEMRAALERRVRDPAFRVIPVLLPGSGRSAERELPSLLGRLDWVDLRKGIRDQENLLRLVAGIQGASPRPRHRSSSKDRWLGTRIFKALLSAWGGQAIWGGLGLFLFCGLTWIVFGEVSHAIEGEGDLVRGGMFFDVSSPEQGTLRNLLVSQGSLVEQGEVVAYLDKSDISWLLKRRKEDLARLRPEAESAVSGLTQQLNILQARERMQGELVLKGLAERGRLLETMDKISRVRESLAAERAKLESLQKEVDRLQDALISGSVIRSPIRGQVVEIGVRPGNFILRGGHVLTIEPSGTPVVATIYLAPKDASVVRAGMRAKVLPSSLGSAGRESIVATVYSVEPMTLEALDTFTKHLEPVVRLAKHGLFYRVSLRLDKGRETAPSAGGTPCTAKIIVGKHTPLRVLQDL